MQNLTQVVNRKATHLQHVFHLYCPHEFIAHMLNSLVNHK